MAISLINESQTVTPSEPPQGHTPEAFELRLRDLCEDHLSGAGNSRGPEDQAKQAVACAREFGCLVQSGLTWDEFRAAETEEERILSGTEHIVDLASPDLVFKTTVPPAFGVQPRLHTHSIPNLRGPPGSRRALEFSPATPLEYLQRLADGNDVFGDAVRLKSVILWRDGLVSFGITQPHYGGIPASQREIETYFRAAGWTQINDPTGQHVLFFNYAFGVLAVDALPRNCYISDAGLQPFDVILHRPDEEMADWLKIYD